MLGCRSIEAPFAGTVTEVSRSGRGQDGGLDILVTTMVRDCIASRLIKWASLGKPTLALVEAGVRSLHKIPGVQYVEFTRRDLGPALAHISSILEARKSQENIGKWVVGGGLALLALYLISKTES